MKKLIESTRESCDVVIDDGGALYFFEFAEGMTVGEIATDFLDGYDGTGQEIQFEMTFSGDKTVYAKGTPNAEAEICDRNRDEA